MKSPKHMEKTSFDRDGNKISHGDLLKFVKTTPIEGDPVANTILQVTSLESGIDKSHITTKDLFSNEIFSVDPNVCVKS